MFHCAILRVNLISHFDRIKEKNHLFFSLSLSLSLSCLRHWTGWSGLFQVGDTERRALTPLFSPINGICNYPTAAVVPSEQVPLSLSLSLSLSLCFTCRIYDGGKCNCINNVHQFTALAAPLSKRVFNLVINSTTYVSPYR